MLACCHIFHYWIMREGSLDHFGSVKSTSLISTLNLCQFLYYACLLPCISTSIGRSSTFFIIEPKYDAGMKLRPFWKYQNNLFEIHFTHINSKSLSVLILCLFVAIYFNKYWKIFNILLYLPLLDNTVIFRMEMSAYRSSLFRSLKKEVSEKLPQG